MLLVPPLPSAASTASQAAPAFYGRRHGLRLYPLLHHSILGAIATGSVTAGRIASRLGRQVSNLAPALGRLVDAGFFIRHEDPIRKQQPTYALADAYLQFHYAILEPHRSRLRSRDPRTLWQERLAEIFDSQVRGPVFEQQARTFVERFASDDTVPGERAHIGPSRLTSRGREWELDLVVTDEHPDPATRRITVIGEAKAGTRIGRRHLDRLVEARHQLGPRAAESRVLLVRSVGLLASQRTPTQVVVQAFDLAELPGFLAHLRVAYVHDWDADEKDWPIPPGHLAAMARSFRSNIRRRARLGGFAARIRAPGIRLNVHEAAAEVGSWATR